jgi:hypothetical protein
MELKVINIVCTVIRRAEDGALSVCSVASTAVLGSGFLEYSVLCNLPRRGRRFEQLDNFEVRQTRGETFYPHRLKDHVNDLVAVLHS